LDDILRSLFPVLAVASWMLVPIYAGIQRGRTFAIFSVVVMTWSFSGALIVHSRLPAWAPTALLPWLDAAFAFGIAAAALHNAHLVRARMRSKAFRWLVSAPGQSFVAGSFMASLWLAALLVVRAPLWLLGFDRFLQFLMPLDLAPYLAAVVAMLFAARPVEEIVRVRLGHEGPDELTRLPLERHRGRPPVPLDSRPLRIIQIADPHLGPWQSTQRLRRTIEDLVDHEPDLALLTGDFLTMESNATPGALAEALSPLRQMKGRAFAIFGNHDHEAANEVREGLAASNIRLLVDASACVNTEAGPVQIVGADFVRREREDHLRGLLSAHPRRADHLRLLLLHDPSAFHDVPDDEVDLVLSGHTHGGQVGLVSFGLDWTVLARSRYPDHGLFARGRTRLYVHRGTGFYGFPLRVGVPGEASLLEVVPAAGSLSSRTSSVPVQRTARS
jgi:predicted MPP superfamily phosphohydrolase